VPRPEVCKDLRDCTEASTEGFKVPCLPDVGLRISRHFVIAVCFISAPGCHSPISSQNSMTASMHKMAEWMSGMLTITVLRVLTVCLPMSNVQGLKFCH
jgi:hypothetical protein